jgi:hypothetical protein
VGPPERLWIAPAGTLPGTIGRVLGAVARGSDTALAAIVWRGVDTGVLRGVSIRAFQSPGATALVRVVDINALRALTPHAYAPVPRPARP